MTSLASEPAFVGKTLAHFRVLSKLGEGGMGVVYRAEDERLRRPVALKVLPPERSADPDRRARLMREARAAAVVSHPNIAVVYEVDEAEGHVYIAMELVGGRSSGRFSTLLAVLAAATSVGEAAALVDLGDGLDPADALTLGTDLQRLLWLRPTTLKDALAAAEMLLASGFPLVVLDLGQPPVRGGRGVEAAWLRLARAARAHDAVLLVGAPYRVSGTAAGVVLKTDRAQAAWLGQGTSPRLLSGCSSQLVLEKRRGQLTGRSEGFTLAAPGALQPAAAPVLSEARLRVRDERPALTAVPPLRRAAAG